MINNPVMNNIVSLSGGKDSTAMLLMMLERNEPIHSVVFFDTGWEFPEMLEHIEKLKTYVWDKYQLKIWTLHPRLPFEYLLLHKHIKSRKGDNKGEFHRNGTGWPAMMRRWCTSQKTDTLNYYAKFVQNACSCVGYAKDEENRKFHDEKIRHRFPLVEWGITEAQALEYCYGKGFDWDGLYNHFSRVSCFCCPLQKLSELKKIRLYFPVLWNKMLEWDAAQPSHNQGFYGTKSVHALDRRFAEEDRQGGMFDDI